MTMTLPAVEDLYPLSPTQQGLLFHSLYGPASGVYVVQVGFTVRGRLNLDAFCRTWQWLVQRHPVLRTAFTWDSLEEPLQVVGRRATLPIDIQDWQAKSREEQAQELADWLERDRRQGFDLSAAPLMRLTILHLTPDTYRILWTYHHLLLDGWSVPLLLRELLRGYPSFEQGNPPPLDTPRPYRDYIAWLKQQDTTAATQFWQQRLQGISAPTPLGIDRPRRLEATPAQYGVQQRSLSPEMTGELRSHAQTHRLTLNTLVQGAWALVLGRYSGEPEVLFGSTCAGRPPTLSGAEAMIGLFINTLPMRVNLSPDQPVNTWLQQLQSQQLDQQPYEFTPLVQIHGSSDIPRSLPLFESVVVFENYPVEPTLKRGLQTLAIEDVTTAEQTNYPLTLFAIAQNTLDLKVQYDCDRFTPAAIERLLGHLETVLTGFITHAKQPIGLLSLLTPAEQQQLQSWNQTERPIPQRGVHELIANQAKTTPDAVAVIFEDTALSYQELDHRANQLANHLSEKGIQPGDRVALCLERSAELVITLLAILKAGATYVPLDPTYPAERLRFILGDAQVSLLITASSSTGGSAPIVDLLTADSMVGIAHPPNPASPPKSPNSGGLEESPVPPSIGGLGGPTIKAITNNTLPILDISDLSNPSTLHGRTTVRPYPSTHPPIHPSTHPPSTLAYLIYTSGSTGSPKGVPIRHQSLTNLLTSMAQAPGITAQDNLLAVTTPAFDIATLELFLPLTVGGTLVIASQETVRDPHKLAAQLEQHNVTLMQATPATWRLLLESGWPGKANLKLLCGGEALDVYLAQQLLTCGAELWNLYGPTETTIWSAALQIEESMLQDGIVPIGPPIANTQFYVLDSQQNPVPIGVPGELHIGGIGLSPGYWQREDLTAERFVEVEAESFEFSVLNFELGRTQNSKLKTQNPFNLYKTGDRVCLREDGTLEYLGRLDHQIKLRSFRIELGEIEAVLAQHPDVSQTVVVLREDKLVAYVVLAEKEWMSGRVDEWQREENPSTHPPIHPPTHPPIHPSLLRQHLSTHLPPYMVPTQFVTLDALPLTPNGKVDRKALPQPDGSLQPEPLTLPRTEVEKAIAALWQSVLNLEQVGLHDNFFDLGGHSLLMVRVHGQIQQRLAIEIPLVDLFRYPTVSSLAAHLRHCDNGTATPERTAELAAGKQRLQQRRQQRHRHPQPPAGGRQHG